MRTCTVAGRVPYLAPQRAQLCLVGVAVDHRDVLDVHGARRVPQRVDALLDTRVRRRYARHHERARVAAQRVLQDARQLGVAIRHVARDSRGRSAATTTATAATAATTAAATTAAVCLLGQCVDDVAQREQAAVDEHRLTKAIACRLRLLLSLAAGEVNKVELGNLVIRERVVTVTHARAVFEQRAH